jgi:hypothetical protein
VSGAAIIVPTVLVQPGGIATGEGVGASALAPVVHPAGAVSLEASGAGFLALVVAPSGAASLETIGPGVLAPAGIITAFVAGAGIESGAVVGAPIIHLPPPSAAPTATNSIAGAFLTVDVPLSPSAISGPLGAGGASSPLGTTSTSKKLGF